MRAAFRTTFSRDGVEFAVLDSIRIRLDSASWRPNRIGGDIRAVFQI